MDKMKAIIFALLLVLLSPAAFALVWQEPYWLPLGTADPNTVAFGSTATAASGAFGSLDTVVHYRAELRRASGEVIKVLEEHDVDISTITGFETVEIAQADYVAGGEYFIRFTISDSRQTENKLLRLNVLSGPQNNPPVLNFISDKSTYENQLIQFSISGSDPDGDSISFSAANLPSGATFDPRTRTFTWLPGSDQAGVYNVIFIVTDEHGATDSQTVTITVLDVNRCPVLAPIGDMDVDEGELLTFSVSAIDSDADTLIYSISRLPAGAVFSPATRTFTWMPSFTQAGIHYITFFVSDGRCVDSETIQVFVHENSQPVVDLVADPQGGVEGTTVTFDCDVVGGDAPLSYLIDFGDGNFVYDSHAAHTYASQGLYVASCTVTDVDGDRGYDATSINISRNHCPVLAILTDQSVQVGNELTFAVSATDADGDALSYSADAPFSAYFDSIARVFSWTPIELQLGNHLATFRVTDGSCEDLQTINIEVTRGSENHAPDAEFNWTPFRPEVGENVTFTSTSSDADGDALVCAWDFNNDGYTDSADCVAGWVFTTPGNHSVTLTVSDGSLSDSVTHTITVLGQLNVTLIDCFSPVIEGSLQSCSVAVESNGVRIGGANVLLHYIDGSEITNCITDMLTGACTVTFPVGSPGDYAVYATAEKASWLPDLDAEPSAAFVVLARRYVISNLAVYNDAAFLNEDYDFFRGEDMYVSFMVLDQSGNPVDGMVTGVALVSPPGGMEWFAEFSYTPRADGYYYYTLNIPTTHDFLGDSQVFTFAFNFTDGSGAEMVVEVIIRNNPPVIDDAVVGEFGRFFNSTEVINLTPYESDVEDSGAALTWSVLGVDSSIAIVTVDANDQLTVTPVSAGYDIITLVLSDLDGDTDMIDVPINTGAVAATACSDGVDNDADGLVDLADPGCESAADNDESNIVVLTQCSNGLDDDSDGLIDIADPGCENASDNDESNVVVLPQCADGFDNDADGLVDLADPGCENASDNDESNAVTPPECSDGLDNDGDGLVDMFDPGCASIGDDDETDPAVTHQCSDGFDNDGDGLIDLADPGCSGTDDDNELDSYVPQCSNGLDDDGDGIVDMLDPGCANIMDNDESNPITSYQCSDGSDNDGDGLVDLADAGCSGPVDDDESNVIIPQCSDGLDNDHDGLVDMLDPDCSSASDDNEAFVAQCADGIDNDLDGRIDWPADVHCASSSDPYEGEIRIREGKKVFRDMDDIIVTRIDINGNDIDRAVVEPGNYVRFSVGLQNNLKYDLKDIKVEAAIYDLNARDTDIIRSLDVDDSATVVFEMDIPEDAVPGLYDVRVVVSNNDARRVKYRTLVVA